jgi:ribosomal protein S18 acetylase RimI-like enzyme
MLALDAKHAFVVHAGESLVALLDLLQGYPVPTTWYLGLIFIAPHARARTRRTVARVTVYPRRRERRHRALQLAVVPDNHRARRLYDRLGFVFVNRRKRSAWTGAVIDCDVLERAG